MSTIDEKNIAKEILFKLLDKNMILAYSASNEQDSIANVSKINQYYTQILNTVSLK